VSGALARDSFAGIVQIAATGELGIRMALGAEKGVAMFLPVAPRMWTPLVALRSE